MINAWLAALRFEQQLAVQTTATYARILTRLQSACPDLRTVSADALQHWLMRENEQGIGGRTLSQHRSALRSFFRYLQKRGLRTDNPADNLITPKTTRGRLPGSFTPDEMQQLLHPPEEDDPLCVRDHAILETLYSTGLRLAELIALDHAELRHTPAQLLIRGKGGHERIIFFGGAARLALARWLRLRPQLAQENEKALFVNHMGTRLGARGVQQRLLAYAKARLPGRKITPHMLRHSFAGHLLQSSGDIRAVQEWLGHRRLGTTQIYTHLDYQHLARVYDQAHPRAKRKKTP